MTYTADNKGSFSTCYQYRLNNDFNEKQVGAASTPGGYLQWSGVLIQGGYFNAGKGSVSPHHEFGGWAPTNFNDGTAITTTNAPNLGKDEGALANGQTAQTPGIIDTQSPRLSYVVNTNLMGRYKNSNINNLRLVKTDEVDKSSGTVLLATYTKYVQALKKSSTSGGAALKTHRPFGAVKVGSTLNDYNSEQHDGIAGAPGDGSVATDLRAITWDEAQSAIADSQTTAGSAAANSIALAQLDNYGEAGSAYTFADGHGAMMRYNADLFDPSDWKWGLRMYTQKNKAIITTDGTNPVH
jgi:hypothetical protein